MLSSRIATSITQIAFWAVLLVLSLGLPRFLVVCTGPSCSGQIEIAHGGGQCCGHEEPGCDAPSDDRGDIACDGHCCCVDVALGMDTAPLPERVTLDLDGPRCHESTSPLVPPSLRGPAVARRPPSTGPPRTDQRTALLATTLLLL